MLFVAEVVGIGEVACADLGDEGAACGDGLGFEGLEGGRCVDFGGDDAAQDLFDVDGVDEGERAFAVGGEDEANTSATVCP